MAGATADVPVLGWFDGVSFPVVVREFCKISLEFIRKGANPKLYQSAGRKYRYVTM